MTIDIKALLPVTHDEAREILSRFNNSRFRNHNTPVNPECDVVLRLGPYIDQCEASADRLEELEEQLRAELAEANKLRKLPHTFAVNVNSLGALDAASQLILDMKAFAARSQPAEPAQREGS